MFGREVHPAARADRSVPGLPGEVEGDVLASVQGAARDLPHRDEGRLGHPQQATRQLHVAVDRAFPEDVAALQAPRPDPAPVMTQDAGVGVEGDGVHVGRAALGDLELAGELTVGGLPIESDSAVWTGVQVQPGGGHVEPRTVHRQAAALHVHRPEDDLPAVTGALPFLRLDQVLEPQRDGGVGHRDIEPHGAVVPVHPGDVGGRLPRRHVHAGLVESHLRELGRPQRAGYVPGTNPQVLAVAREHLPAEQLRGVGHRAEQQAAAQHPPGPARRAAAPGTGARGRFGPHESRSGAPA